MHGTVFQTFDEICRAHRVRGSVLEIGAVPAPDTLLALPSLAGVQERIGINLAIASVYAGCRILQGDAHDMRQFETARFDAVLCNSVLEHDGRFWLSLAEMRRVAKPGALIVIGVPGYALPKGGRLRWLMGQGASRPPLGWLCGKAMGAFLASTPVLGIHNAPGDYYRFSEQACREIFMDGLERSEIHQVMQPPRFIAAGYLPGPGAAGSPPIAPSR